ncbi:hypothetical protein PG994_015226 [Apiospora phragmitis]|uniref:GH64 domain-containing protein n=1 Tax=Apiospora phragmitis TaxID=2905665 RepID=A0ABR1SQW7_9PEZI
MSIQETFEEIPWELRTDSLMVPIPNRDANAMTCMLTLSDNLAIQPPGVYARGSWGYAILRTVYTPESNDLFPAAIAKLEVWMRKYHLHINRFPMWGEIGEAKHRNKANGSINDELGRRFRVELLEDKDRMDLPHLNRASHDDIGSLCDVFDTWVASVGQDHPRDETTSISPRFCDCLVVDEEALRSLAALSEDPPQLHVAADCATKQHIAAMTASKRAIVTNSPGINAGISNNCMALKPLKVEVINNIKGSQLFVYITGVDQVGATKFLTRSVTWFYPVVAEDASFSLIDQALISIPIAEQPNVFAVTIQDCVVSGRIWISLGQLPFHVAASDGGSPYLVPPSVLDSTNTSNTVDWGFVELTHTDRDGLYANLSFVDFVGLILSLTLTLEQGDAQKVIGLASDGVYSVCEQLRQQSRLDGLPWDQLCVTAPSGRPLRVLSPNLYESIHREPRRGTTRPMSIKYGQSIRLVIL